MNLNRVDIKPIPNHTYKVVITFDQKKQTFYLTFSYKELCEYWVMTIKDVYNNDILSNVPVLTGGNLSEAGNLLKQFGYKNLGSMIVWKARQNDNDSPGPRELGIDFEFYWGDTITYEITKENLLGEVQS